MTLLEALPPYLTPAPAPAPSLVSPFPNEGAPLEECLKSAPLIRRKPEERPIRKTLIRKADGPSIT
jgi:hypothetical protein